MKCEFPIIKNISDILPAIEGKDEFIINEKPGYKICNYLVQLIDTFEDPYQEDISEQEKLYRLIRRECRGIIFDSNTGNIISRPMAKFFNLNEKPETHYSNIDLSESHVILDKVDGSFVRSFLVNGRMIYGTKMGETFVTPLVEEFIADKPHYNEFNLMLLNKGFTPIYEFVSRANRVVLAYQETNLILLAIRNMITGEYHNYEVMKNLGIGFNIPVANALPGSIENMELFAEQTREKTGIEGYVVRFNSGKMLKIKSDEYCVFHKVKDLTRMEKNVLLIIMEDKCDDLISMLADTDKACVEKYCNEVTSGLINKAKELTDIVEQAKLKYFTKKDFAINVANVREHRNESSILFKIYDGADGLETLKSHIKNQCGSQSRVDEVRNLFGNAKYDRTDIGLD